MINYTLDYRGYTISVKGDFGSGFHLIDGMPCNAGYVVTQKGMNVIPGAGWFQTVEDAKLGIDCLMLAAGNADSFRTLYRGAREAERIARADFLADLTLATS